MPKLEKYRLNPNCIYQGNKKLLDLQARSACLFGYAFIKHNDNYYKVHIKTYKSKPECIIIQLVEVELVEGYKEVEDKCQTEK